MGLSSEKRPADVGRSSEKRPADALCLDYRPKKLARSARLSAALKDYGKLLEDFELADVTFAVDGQRFPAHRCVLAARSAFFSGMFKSGKGMSEGGGSAAGQDMVIKEVSAGAFRVLLRFLYENVLPEDENCKEALSPGEMARVADLFQAEELYEHCVGQFLEAMSFANAIERLVLVHGTKLAALENAVMECVVHNYWDIQVRFNKDTLRAREGKSSYCNLYHLLLRCKWRP